MKTLAAVLATVLPVPAVVAAEPVDYLRDVKPILAEKCYACHGALQQRGELRLDAAQLIRQGGASGPVIVPGQADESLLIWKVTGAYQQRRMPPPREGEPLSAKQIATLRAWIDQGAKADDEPVPPDPREHWAYQPPLRPPVPIPPPLAPVPGTQGPWVKNPIDAFILVELDRRGLVPAPPAPKHVLLRRVYLDLTGLPPTQEELHAFLADDSPDAYEKVVDRLLNSPRYGERWARHWMDVWRYSDWSGYGNEIRNSQRHIWRWRDWIVESLNADKGYDRMILEMLAGDEIAPTDPQVLRATGFLARNWYKFNRNVWMDDAVEHTAKAFLGMTMNCAKCHDHKYDPISQRHYYQFRAFFEPYDVRTDRVPGVLDVLQDGLPRVYDAHTAAPTYLFVRGNDKELDKTRPLLPGLPDVFAAKLNIRPVPLPLEAYAPDLRPFVINDLLAAAEAAVQKAEAELAKARTASRGRQPPEDQHAPGEKAPSGGSPPPLALTIAEKQLVVAQLSLVSLKARIAADQARHANPPPAQTDDLAREASQAERQLAVQQAELAVLRAEQALAVARAGKPEDKKTQEAIAKAEKDLAAARKTLEAAKAALAMPGTQYTPLGKEYPRTSTGRRLALAKWITDRRNPLTARVAVNHMWLRHFGAPLVDNVFDFGLRSPKPRHAALLDWLAVELMTPPPLGTEGPERGWSMKKLHRLMVTSNTYRMDSSGRDVPEANRTKDPDNLFLWRMNSRRLEAEAVRDSILYVAGNLDLTMGGPDIDHNQGLTSRRRSLYFRHAYEKKMKFVELFDGPSELECYRRSESVAPQQALALANSTLALGQSRLLARQLAQDVAKADDPDRAFITHAFEQVLSRPPTAEELKLSQEFLTEQAKLLADPAKLTPFTGGPAADVKPSPDPKLRAKENLVHVLLNLSEFVTIR
jgi:hypothetical protein